MGPADERQKLVPNSEFDKSQGTKSKSPHRPRLSGTGLEGCRLTVVRRLTDPPRSAARDEFSCPRRAHSEQNRNSKQQAGVHSNGQLRYVLMGQTPCETPRPCESLSASQPRSFFPSAARCPDETPCAGTDAEQGRLLPPEHVGPYLCALRPPAWCRCNVKSCCLVGKCHGHRCNGRIRTVTRGVLIFGLLVAVAVLAVLLSGRSPAVLGPACPDSWVGYQGKCYYFSEGEGNWTDSWSHCSALGASLAGIDTPQEMAFMMRHKGKFDHWIGLRRDPGQPWKWSNGTKFNSPSNIRGGGDCAFLNDENGVGSSRCTSEERWICSKPDTFTAAKKTPAEGSS